MRAYLPHGLIQTWPHKAIRSLYLRLTWASLAEMLFAVSAAVGTALLTVYTLPPDSRGWGLALLVLLVLLGLLRGLTALGHANTVYRVRHEVLQTILRQIHRFALLGSKDFRLTIFIEDPIFQGKTYTTEHRTEWCPILIPLHRRHPGDDPRCWRTSVYYPVKCRAVTTEAWRESADARDHVREQNFLPLIQRFPAFSSRAEMEQHYRDTIGLDPALVARISDHMIDVRAIISVPLVDDRENPLALLSIDSKVPIHFKPGDGRSKEEGNDVPEGAVEIREEIFSGYLEGVRAVVATILPNPHQ